MKYKLGDICTKIGSGATPRGGKDAYCNEGITLVRSQNVLDFSFSDNGLAFINEEQAARLNNVEVLSGDILLNITGDSVARACMMEDSFLPERVNQHVAIIRGKNDVVINRYLLYFLQWKKSHLLQLASGGATRNALTKGMIEQLEIDLPQLSQQKKIVNILGSLDDKIALNNKINDNLEQQAEAIYNYMFIVNNDPDWKHGCLKDLVNVKYGKDHKKLADGPYPVYGSGGIMRYVERPLYEKESVLIPRKGTLNNVIYVNQPFWSVDTMFYTEMKIPNVAKFVYQFVKSKDLTSMNAGSAVPSMTTDILNAMEIDIPPAEILEKFEAIVAPMYQMIQRNNEQSGKLATLRDALLPKLLSGED